MSVVDEILADEDSLKIEFSQLSYIQMTVVNWQMKWLKEAHKHQIEPAGDWWSIWLMLAGRGAFLDFEAAHLHRLAHFHGHETGEDLPAFSEDAGQSCHARGAFLKSRTHPMSLRFPGQVQNFFDPRPGHLREGIDEISGRRVD